MGDVTIGKWEGAMGGDDGQKRRVTFDGIVGSAATVEDDGEPSWEASSEGYSEPNVTSSGTLPRSDSGISSAPKNDFSKFKAILRKNFTLKTRGAMCCCSGAEVLAPIIMFLLLSLPKLLVDEDTSGASYYNPAAIFDPTWAGEQACPDENAFKLVYTPDDTVSTQVAADAGLKLYCNSFMNVVGFCSAFDVDIEKIEAAGISSLAQCEGDLSRCQDEFVLESQRGAIFLQNLTDAFVDEPLICDSSCDRDPNCITKRQAVLDSFLVGKKDMQDAVDYALEENNRGQILGVIGLPKDLDNSSAIDLTYTLRFNGSDIPYTSFDFALAQRTPDDAWKNYFSFVNVQNAFDEALINNRFSVSEITALNAIKLNLAPSVKEYPFPKWKTNYAGVGGALFFGQVFVFAYITTVVLIMQSVVHEKELRIREGMKIMGLSDKTYWATWFLTNFITLFLAAAGMALIGLYPFSNSNAAVLFLFYILFAIELIFFSYFITTFFNSSRTAAIVGSFLYILSWAPGVALAVIYPNGSTGWTLSALAPASAVYMWGLALAIQELTGEGLDWDNLGDNLTREGSFSSGGLMAVVSGGAVLYLFLAWYFDKVLPKEYGTRYPPWFLFSPSYWRDRHRKSVWRYGSTRAALSNPESDCSENSMDYYGDQKKDIEDVIEAAPPGARAAIRIRSLYKRFGPDPSTQTKSSGWWRAVRNFVMGPSGVVAVDNLSLDIYSGQITALLGPNGAGKTTTISMLTGMIEADSGDVTVNGYSLKGGISQIRRSLGVCPQFDILWPNLTVIEHLQIYAAFKGIKPDLIDKTVFRAIKSVDLIEKMDEVSSRLSGGQRRKLSLAIAFIGDPKVVILDEPTSGMDPYARRKTWSVISRLKEGRTIIMTTHFMDEADLLSDRIAIMAKGRLVCCGSSLFLKTKFGAGYHLTLEMGDKKDRQSVHEEISDVISKNVSTAYLQSAGGSELSFLLPNEDTASFPELLDKLQVYQDNGYISSYGISCSTLEDVFLAIASSSQAIGIGGSTLEISPATAQASGSEIELSESGGRDIAGSIRDLVRQRSYHRAARHMKKTNSSDSVDSVTSNTDLFEGSHDFDSGVAKGDVITTKWFLRWKQFISLLRKRYILARRDRLSLLTLYIVPVLFVVFAMTISLLSPSTADQPAITLGGKYLGGKPVVLGASSGQISPGTAGGIVVGRYPTYPGLQDSNTTFMYNCTGGLEATDTLLTIAQTAALNNVTESDALTSVNSDVLDTFAVGNCTTDLRGSLDSKLIKKANTVCVDEDGGSCGSLFIESYDIGSRVFESTILSSGSAYHGLPTGLNLINSAIFSALLGDAGLSVVNHPLPSTDTEIAESEGILNTLLALCIVIAGASLSASFSVHLVKEKAIGSKHIQLVSGINQTLFWISNLLWDLLNFLIPAGLMMIIVVIFNVEAYQGAETRLNLFVLICAFGWAAIPLTYLLHFPFDNEMNCLAAQMGIFFFFGLVFLLAGIILEALVGTSEGVDTAWDILQWIFRVLPHYNLGKGVYNIARNSNLGERFQTTSWDLEVTGYELIFLAWQGPFFFALSLATEYGYTQKVFWFIRQAFPGGKFAFCPPGQCIAEWFADDRQRMRMVHLEYHNMLPPVEDHKDTKDEDEDVAQERARIEEDWGDDVVVAQSLMKKFKVPIKVDSTRPSDWTGEKLAVKNLTFGVRRGSVFGLLGVNGAGKSTTFKMLTGEFAPSDGDAFVRSRDGDGFRSHSIVTQKQLARQHMGYCPQYDALLYNLSVREHLNFYASIRGLQSECIPNVVNSLLQRLNLTQYANRKAGTLSGGNKRKTSVAISLIGNPSIVLLDEPSTGMDPEARRFMWDVISESMADRAVVLTSHSMEECEALCNNVGIMVNGEFRALGSVQHLKNRYGDGYNLEIRTVSGLSRDIKRFVELQVPSANLYEEHPSQLKYRIRTVSMMESSLTIAKLFRIMEERKIEDENFLDYSISQTALEQVFLSFAKHQHDESWEEQKEEVFNQPVPGSTMQKRIAVKCPHCSTLLACYSDDSVIKCSSCGSAVCLTTTR